MALELTSKANHPVSRHPHCFQHALVFDIVFCIMILDACTPWAYVPRSRVRLDISKFPSLGRNRERPERSYYRIVDEILLHFNAAKRVCLIDVPLGSECLADARCYFWDQFSV